MKPALMALLAACLAFAACGDDDQQGEGAREPVVSVDLRVRFTDGEGRARTAVLRCGDGDAVATGWLREEACADAAGLAAFLADEPPADRVCTQIYGGPQRARIRGTIGDRVVDRAFSRTDGCEITDYNRVQPLLPASSGPR